MVIMTLLGHDNFQEFLFAKNLKIFGNINAYVDDFFAKNTVNKVKALPYTTKLSTVGMLRKMLSYPDLSESNRVRLTKAITELSPVHSAAAAGRRKTKRRFNRSRRNMK
jgi:hypothetical protein